MMDRLKTTGWSVALTAALVLIGQPLAANAKGEPAESVVTLNAMDYSYKGPDRIKGGVVKVEINNGGKELHHAQLIQLLDGKTFDDFVGLKPALSGPLPRWAKFVGGPNGAIPGEKATAVMNLEPGNYVVACLIPDAKGVPHLALGMMKPLTVTAAETKKAEPKADVTITVADFRFVPSQPLTAGKHTIKVVNNGTMPHELLLVRMAPGKKVADFGAFEADRSAPPPGKPIGGIVGVQNGMHTYFETDLAPGNYGLICFFPDEKGEPHFKRGMTLDFTVE
ncbi:MAG: hypothetical protein HY282_08015 [Nitrospirae bacterium]|nr:hypothetical protein [Candidatus Manganitrophaceae bacterium]